MIDMNKIYRIMRHTMLLKQVIVILCVLMCAMTISADSAPVITKQPQNQTVTEGSSVTFSVTAAGEGIEHKNFTTSLSDTVNLDMVWCPPGTFMMGSPEDEIGRGMYGELLHQVTLTKGFWIGKYPITQAQYKTVIGNNPSMYKGDNNPVEQVNWYDAVDFCAKLTEFERRAGRLPEGYKYVLPTDAQWEYACRAGTTTALNSGKNLTDADECPNMDAVGWYQGNSGGHPHPVGQKLPNAWGLYDMHGNVWEWCLDYWENTDYPYGQAVIDPTGITYATDRRVHRGGSSPDIAGTCRSASRWGGTPSLGHYGNGIRVVLVESDNSAIGNLNYQWYKDGFMLQGATDREYTIDKVSQSDAGQYFVIVKNEIDSVVSDLATLTVAVPPVIVKQPEDISVLEGEEVLLCVEAEHAETYQWYKDSNIIHGATNAVYRIVNAFQEDAGQYYVLVGNQYKSVQSDKMTLEVYKIPVITQQPVSVSVSGGKSATFSVKAENATSYQWYRDGFAIAGADQSSYTIGVVTSYDIGKYFVIVSNERTNIISDVATLEISEAYRAKAEAIIANGFVIGFVITDPGWGYEWTPNIRIKDENGNGAEARCVMENGMIVGIVIDEPGSGYTKDATVKIGSPYNFDSLSIQASEVLITMYVNLGEKYQLECTEDHITWKKVGEPFIAEDEEVHLRLEVVDHSYYFRVHEVK